MVENKRAYVKLPEHLDEDIHAQAEAMADDMLAQLGAEDETTEEEADDV